MCTCEIRWIDRNGNPTPDTNKAIGRVMRVAYTDYGRSGQNINFPATDWYPICEWHARRLSELGMHNWKLERFHACDACGECQASPDECFCPACKAAVREG